jgi:hypothetical protein
LPPRSSPGPAGNKQALSEFANRIGCLNQIVQGVLRLNGGYIDHSGTLEAMVGFDSCKCSPEAAGLAPLTAPAAGGSLSRQTVLLGLGAEKPAVLQLSQDAGVLHRSSETVYQTLRAFAVARCYKSHSILLDILVGQAVWAWRIAPRQAGRRTSDSPRICR